MRTFKDPYINAAVEELDNLLYGSERLYKKEEEQEKLSYMLDRWRFRLEFVRSLNENPANTLIAASQTKQQKDI